MAFRYTDITIPKRPHRGGNGSRSSSDAGDIPDSRWTMITQEELFTGSRPERKRAEDGKASGPFARLLKMTKDYQVTDQGRREAFLKQARAMESYTEDGPIQCTDEYHAFVGYQEMSPKELHGYFAWRTKLSKGEMVPVSFSFLLLHAAELINLIGARDEQDAFDKLLRCMSMIYADPRDSVNKPGVRPGLSVQRRQALKMIPARLRSSYEALAKVIYCALEEGEKDRLDRILQDFVISWGPDPEIVQEYCVPDPEREWDNVTLSHLSGSDDASIWRVIRHLAERRTLNSPFRKEAGEDLWRVTSRVFRRVCLEQEKKGNQSGLAQRLLGVRRETVRELFPWIPFQPRVEDGYRIEISPVTSYTYRGGKWYRLAYPVMRSDDALRELNALVRECERVLRRKTRFRSQLSDQLHDPRLVKLIEEEYDRWIREKELRNRPEIHVDLSRLGKIREQAAITRDRLLEGTEEGAWEEALNAAENEGAKPEVLNAAKNERTEPEALNASAICSASGSADGGNEPLDMLGDSPDRETLPDRLAAEESLPGENLSGADSEFPSAFFHPEESAFLRMLLNGENGKAYFRTHKVLPSVFVDVINEKAYDKIGDSIVEETGSGWELVEDYVEDVRNLLGPDS